MVRFEYCGTSVLVYPMKNLLLCAFLATVGLTSTNAQTYVSPGVASPLATDRKSVV